MKKTILVLFSIICLFTLILFAIFNFAVYPKSYKNYVIKYSEEYKLQTALVYAIIKTESNFKSDAKSPSGAIGLMQLMPSTAKWIALELKEGFEENNLYNQDTNIKYGCFYLNYLFNKFENMDTVICAYNAGETIVRSWLNDEGVIDINKISYAETKNYLKRVKSYYNIYVTNELGL